MDTTGYFGVDLRVHLADAPTVTDCSGVEFVPRDVRYAIHCDPEVDRSMMTQITVYGPEFDNVTYGSRPFEPAPAWVPPAPEWLVDIARSMGAVGDVFVRCEEELTAVHEDALREDVLRDVLAYLRANAAFKQGKRLPAYVAGADRLLALHDRLLEVV